MSKFTVYADNQNEFRWKFAANDNTVIAKSSQGFKVKEECLTSLSLLQKEVGGATVDHEVRTTSPQVSPSPAPVAPAPALASSPVAASSPGVVAKN
jgi:uncharacterized protein YegP (UPF0339 family)